VNGKSKPKLLDSLTDSSEWSLLDKSKWPDLLDATDWMLANGHLREWLVEARKPERWGYLYTLACILEDAPNLLPDERWAMFQIFLAGLRASRRQQIPGESEVKAGQMAAYSMLLEADGDRPKKAISKTMERYNVSSNETVYAARRRFHPLIQEKGLDRKWRDNPEWRKKQRRIYEETAKFWWSQRSKPTLGSLCLFGGERGDVLKT
jgi:hypothetical protein